VTINLPAAVCRFADHDVMRKCWGVAFFAVFSKHFYFHRCYRPDCRFRILGYQNENDPLRSAKNNHGFYVEKTAFSAKSRAQKIRPWAGAGTLAGA
jgi:hypothetical protein